MEGIYAWLHWTGHFDTIKVLPTSGEHYRTVYPSSSTRGIDLRYDDATAHKSTEVKYFMKAVHIVLMGAVFLGISATRPSSIFTVHNVNKTWMESRAICRGNGGHLLSIQSSQEWDMWRHLLKPTIPSLGRFSGPFWSGLHAPNAGDLDTFSWDDCSAPVYLNNMSPGYPLMYDPCVHIELQREVFNGVFVDLWLKGQDCNDSLPMVCETEILDCLPMECEEAVINTSDVVCNTELCKFVSNDSNTCQVHPIDDNATLCHVFTALHRGTDYFSVCYISNPNHTFTRCPVDLTINYNVTISEAFSLSACLTDENRTTDSSDLQNRTNQAALCTCPSETSTKKFSLFEDMFKSIIGMVQKLTIDLAIDKKNTSRTRMKKECARDNRPSSVSIGVIGVIIMTVPIVLVIIPDLPKLYVELRKMRRNIRSGLKRILR